MQRVAEASCLDNIGWRLCDVQQTPVPDASVDGVFARGLMCFDLEAAQVIAKIDLVLRPGGVLAVMDYSNRRAFRIFASSKTLNQLVQDKD